MMKLKMYEKTILLNPNDLRAYNNLSLILEKKIKLKKLLKYVKKLLLIQII